VPPEPHAPPPPDLAGLLAAVADRPDDEAAKLVLADWLEEHDDPRGGLFRLLATGGSLDPWLKAHGNWWPGKDGRRFLHREGGALYLEWHPPSTGRGRELIENGWVTDVRLRGPRGLRAFEAAWPLLRRLTVSGWADAADLEPVWSRAGLTALGLYLWGRHVAGGLPRLAELPQLRELRLGLDAAQALPLKTLDQVGRLTGLTSLGLLSWGDRAPDGPLCPALGRLESLDLRSSEGLSTCVMAHPGPPTLRHLVLEIDDGTTTGEVARLAALPALESFAPDLPWHGQADLLAGVAELASLRRLDLGDFVRRRVTDAGLSHLPRLSRLESLNVGRADVVSDGGLRRLAGLTRLTELSLVECPALAQEGATAIGSLTALRSLNLSGCPQFTDACLARLSGLADLEVLDLSGCERITGTGLRVLSGLARLRGLNLRGYRRLADGGLDHLAGLGRLEWLDVGGWTGVTEAVVVAHLAALPALRQLRVSSSISGAALKRVRKALPHCQVWNRS